MKRLLTLLMTFALLAGLTLPAAAAENTTTFKLLANGQSSASVMLGDTVTVTLVLNSGDGKSIDLYSMQDYLCFDPAYLEFVSGSIQTYPVTEGGLPEQILQASPVKFSASGTDVYNRIYLNRANSTAQSIKTGSVLLSFQLKAVQAGETVLSHAIPELFRIPGQLNALKTKDASITIIDQNGGGGGGGGGGGSSIPEVPEKPVQQEPPVQTELPFVDVGKSDWFYDSVYTAYNGGLFNGVDATHFQPNANTTRGMMATLMFRFASSPEYFDPNEWYADVEDNFWYTDAIYWATVNGVMIGYGNGNFGPDDLITREQFATVLWRYHGKPSSGAALDDFSDSGTASGYAVPALQWAVESGILNGRGGGILAPADTATRAEVAAMLTRFMALA